ncbi:MAG: serine/threonine-protein kinase [Kofleriaceae bacterium]
MSCPDPNDLLAFTAGTLDDKMFSFIEEHIDTCTDCRGALSNFAKADAPATFGRYRIDTVLGSGGMGIVYRAFDPQLNRPIAIKVVRSAHEDAKGRARLTREAQALARLSHPNVCHVYDVGTENDEVWVAMELIDGVSLREWAHSDRLLEVLIGAARGIAAANEAGLVHRDIKPENVLVTNDGRAIVTDFGLARGDTTVDPNASTVGMIETLTAKGAIAGTPAYIAPEQLTGDPIDARVDQFAFAVMAWELLTGTRPFPVNMALRIDAVRQGVTPPPTMPKHIGMALTQAMQVSPRDRFPKMRDLIEALQTPTTEVVRKQDIARERRARGPIYASLALVAMTGAAVTAWKWPRAAAHEASTTTEWKDHTPNNPPPPVVDAAVVAPPIVVDAAPMATQPLPSPAVIVKKATEKGIGKIQPPPVSQDKTIAVMKRHNNSGNERREAAIATLDAFCFLPYDNAHPDKDLPHPVADWGKVTSIEHETGSLMGEDIESNIMTIQGARNTYRVMEEVKTLNYVVPAHVGETMVLCADREEDNLYRFPGGPTLPVNSVFPISGAAPRIIDVAKYKPLHTDSLAMTAAFANQRPGHLKLDRTYIIRAKVLDMSDSKRWKLDRFYMDVPPNTPGADRVEVNREVWVVVDHLHYDDEKDDQNRKPFGVRAVVVLGEMFPD